MTIAQVLSTQGVLVVWPLKEETKNPFNTAKPLGGNCSRYIYQTSDMSVWDVESLLENIFHAGFRYIQVFGSNQLDEDWKKIVRGARYKNLNFIDSTVD